jgi:hypothetical protein
MSTLARWSAASIAQYLPLMPFAERLPDICKVNARTELVIAESLLSLWAIITRRPPPSSREASVLSRALSDSAIRLEDGLAMQAARSACSSLRARVDARITEEALEVTDERRVWSQLRNVLLVDEREHHSVSYKMSHVYMIHERSKLGAAATAVRAGDTLKEAAEKHLDDRILRKITRARDNWIGCAEFFDREMTPRLRKLIPILEGEECRRKLGRYAARLLAFCDSRELLLDHRFSHLLHDAVSEPSIILAPENWEVFRSTSDWIFEGLLKWLDAESMAPLRRLIGSVPALVGIAFTNALTELEIDGRAPDVQPQAREVLSGSSIAVFCPEDLLKETFHQVLVNVWKHQDQVVGHDVLLSEIATVDATLDEKEDAIVISMNSYHTKEKPHSERGSGLSGLRTRLQSFGCDLVAESGVAPVSFSVTLILRKDVADVGT